MQKDYHFTISSKQFLDENGQLTEPLPDFLAKDSKTLIKCYETMVLTRIFDQKAVSLQRTGQLGTYASILGQEAVGIAMAYFLDDKDILIPYYRDYSAQLFRGVRMVEILQYWGGDERGNDFRNARHDLAFCIPIATQCCHAVGVAAAMKIKHEKHVVTVACGDGATSKGDFLESINVAGIWQLPIIFVVNNNQWAISVPRNIQTAAETIAQKAIGAGINGEQVDGNDVIALLTACKSARDRAIKGKGPTLIEAVSYRLGDHTTADDATRYRSTEEVKAAWSREPLKRLRHYLVSTKLWDEEKELSLQENCKQAVKAAVDEYLNLSPQAATDFFNYLYASLPTSLAEQRKAFIEKTKRMQRPT